MLRVIQEALGNVRKHARARRVQVSLVEGEGDLTLSVRDDGVGFDPQAPRRLDEFPHFGLTTMRERAESAGGMMSLETRPGEGTRVSVRFPIRQRVNPLPAEGVSHARADR